MKNGSECCHLILCCLNLFRQHAQVFTLPTELKSRASTCFQFRINEVGITTRTLDLNQIALRSTFEWIRRHLHELPPTTIEHHRLGEVCWGFLSIRDVSNKVRTIDKIGVIRLLVRHIPLSDFANSFHIKLHYTQIKM